MVDKKDREREKSLFEGAAVVRCFACESHKHEGDCAVLVWFQVSLATETAGVTMQRFLSLLRANIEIQRLCARALHRFCVLLLPSIYCITFFVRYKQARGIDSIPEVSRFSWICSKNISGDCGNIVYTALSSVLSTFPGVCGNP